MGIIAKTAERLELLTQMMEKTGARVDADLSQSGSSKIQSAIIACLGCQHVDECKGFLQQVEGEVSPPEFCANVNRLPTMRPH